MDLFGSIHDIGVAIAEVTGQSDTILHIHAGMAAFMLARLVSRRSLATFGPFVFVAIIALAKEALDRLAFGAWRWENTLFDLANTLFWPLALTLAVWWRPMILRDRYAIERA